MRGFTVTLLLVLSSCGLSAQTVPFRSAKGLIFVDVQVNGIPVSLLLDSGAASSLISYHVAGLAESMAEMKNASESQHNGRFDGNTVSVPVEMVIVGKRIRELPVFAGNVDDLSRVIGVHCDGLLGEDVLRHFHSIRIDYKKHVVEFTP